MSLWLMQAVVGAVCALAEGASPNAVVLKQSAANPAVKRVFMLLPLLWAVMPNRSCSLRS